MQLYLLKYLVLVQAALFLGNILKAPTRQVLRNIPGCEMNWEGCFLLHQVSTFNFQHGGFGSQVALFCFLHLPSNLWKCGYFDGKHWLKR